LALIDDIKSILRISASITAYNTEITDIINAAKDDLKLSGVLSEKIVDSDPLIKRAITTYTKTTFGWNNPDADRFQKSYDLLKQHLTTSIDYARYTVTFLIKDAATLAAIDDASVIFDGETKTTNSSGQVLFYTRAGNSLKYSVKADGYQEFDTNKDITASTTIEILLSEIGA
jgi:hypothetical protein